MKKTIFNLAAILVSASLIFTSCHKKESTTPDDTATQATTAGDAFNVDNESNRTLDETNVALSGTSSAKIAAGATASLISNATIDTTNLSSSGYITITYNGKSSDSTRIRTGVIKVQLGPNFPTKWSTQGTTLTLTYTNYKVTRVSNGKSITLNGTKTITNASGGNIYNIPSGGLIHTIAGTLSITFDDGTVRTWTVSKQRVITSTSITVTGTGSTPGYTTGVVYTGINRFGSQFEGVIETPIVYTFALNEITSGKFLHNGPRGQLTVTFGVDISGNTTTAIPYGYRLDWTGLDGKAKTAVLPY